MLKSYFLTLKSNMDRFIGLVKYGDTEFKRTLKSNMDRFIGPFTECELIIPYCFKIQYG